MSNDKRQIDKYIFVHMCDFDDLWHDAPAGEILEKYFISVNK